MFPHTITIFRHIQDLTTDTYIKHVLNGVYWYGSKHSNKSSNGVIKEKNINIIIPKNLVDSFKIEWDININDKVVLGEVDDITSVNDLKVYEDVINADDISINICNSDLDNIVISGK